MRRRDVETGSTAETGTAETRTAEKSDEWREFRVRPGLLAVAILFLIYLFWALPAEAGAQTVTDSGDPVLDDLIAEALGANPGVHAVEARVDGARADRFDATLDLAPRITAIGAYTRQRLSGASFPEFGEAFPDQDVWEVGSRLSWELDAFGRLRNSLRASSELVNAAGEDVEAVRVDIAAEVAREYYRLRGRDDRLAVARRNAENQRRTLDLTLERLDAGRGTALDTERARAQLSTTLASIPALEADVAASRHRIAALIGRQPGDEIPALATVEIPDDGKQPTDELAGLRLPAEVGLPDPAALVRDRPDVLGAMRRHEAGSALVSSARASYLPRFSIEGGAGYTAEAFDAIGDSGTFRYGIGAVVSWPLFDLGRVKANVDAAQAQESEARRLYERAVLDAHEQIETSLVVYNTARRRLGHLADAAEASERATELARLRFESGATDFLEVLDSERRLLEAQDGLAAGRLETAAAFVNVFRVSGGVWPESAE